MVKRRSAAAGTALCLLLAGCGESGARGGAPRSAPSTVPTTLPDSLVVTFTLPSASLAAGSSETATVTVDNTTGHAVTVAGCGGLFGVAIRDAAIPQAPGAAACRQDFSVPPGTSAYTAVASATYLSCSQGPPQGPLSPSCLPGPEEPPLPPGVYQAALYGAFTVEAPDVPLVLPAPLPVTVTPPVTTAGNTPLALALSFSDAEHGAVVASVCMASCRDVAFTTADGGGTFRQAGTITGPQTPAAAAVRGVAVSGNDLLAWGTGGAWSSHDGGATWQPRKLADGVQDVVAVAASGRSWWVVQAPSGGDAGDDVVMQSDDGGSTFLALGGPIDGGVRAAARARASAAVLLYDDHLDVTADGGATWARRPRPCPSGPFAYGTGAIAAAPDGVLWMACGTEPSAGAQLKALYRSADAGRTWSLVEDCSELPPAGCSWPGGEYGYLVTLASPSASAVWMGLARAALVGTLDGGKTWTVPPTGGGDLGVSQIEFVDALHGWAVIERAVWRTVDGGRTWQRAGQL